MRDSAEMPGLLDEPDLGSWSELERSSYGVWLSPDEKTEDKPRFRARSRISS
ncbi:hypothetical protein [Pasteuria penetrans]|uniref:hypothetical protein n=1 Tax=Pasteuria penetrans TaxID=86005 RepID=UPI001CAA6697|nr:hypothetical protein [Pasteuria penetrans]